jgi:adenosylmethionine-8-amino-7-oxononanoate aminotransferase
MERGILLRPIGNTVYWMPPYIIDEEQCQLLGTGTLAALHAALDDSGV